VIFSVAVEGGIDLAAAKRILEHTGHLIGREYVLDGKHQLNAKLLGYNNAAKFSQQWFVLRDLDHDSECAPSLVAELLPAPAPGMVFRLAVHEIEAWLIADSEGLAAFLGVSAFLFREDPDSIDDPKSLVVRAAAGSARKNRMAPRPGLGRETGLTYVLELISFIASHWSIERAAERSDSLRRCVEALRRL